MEKRLTQRAQLEQDKNCLINSFAENGDTTIQKSQFWQKMLVQSTPKANQSIATPTSSQGLQTTSGSLEEKGKIPSCSTAYKDQDKTVLFKDSTLIAGFDIK